MSDQETASFSDEQIDVICAVEQLWYETGSIPTNEAISEKTGVTMASIQRYWTQEAFRNALLVRGVDLNPRTSGLLTLQQLNLANRLLNMHDARSVREKLQECSVSPQQYTAWLRQPAFRDYLAKRGEEMFKSSDHEAYGALVGAVRGGDMRAVQLFFEMRGIYNPKQTIEIQNISVVLVRVVEIVAKHVGDPAILGAIAEELEMLEIGNAGGQPIHAPVMELPAVSSSSFSI